MSQELSILERQIVTDIAFGKTFDEVSTLYGVPYAESVAKVKRYLSARNPLTATEEKLLIIDQARQLAGETKKQLDAGNSKSVEAYLKVLRTIFELLEKQSKFSQEELEAAARAQAQQMIKLIEAGYLKAREMLVEEYPDVDVNMIDARFQQGMHSALTT